MTTPPTVTRAQLVVRPADADERRSTITYLLHQAVADLFGDRDTRGYLYRLMRQQQDRYTLLVLSTEPPLPLTQVPRRPNRWAEQLESKPYDPHLAPGQVLDFEILVNATRVKGDNGHGNGQRVDLWDAVWGADPHTTSTPAEVYGDYLTRHLAGAAEVVTSAVTARGELRARRGGRRDVAQFVATNLVGSLAVVDPAALLEILGKGIGRAKAFGCGLLCLSRPGSVLGRRG